VWGIIGLGNPGVRYDGTRHNVGFAVVEHLAHRWCGEGQSERFSGVRSLAAAHPFLVWPGKFAGIDVVLVKPTTYVNRSGLAVRALLDAYEAIDIGSLLVIVDDVALPFGRLRLRAAGSAGGHNGLRSIEASLARRDYARLRLGVGAQRPGEDLADHVLGPFAPDEVKELPALLLRAASAVEAILRDGVEPSLAVVNDPGGAAGDGPF
jgi:PTH1 family peptidyl-tRNA hydrolase